VQAVDSLQLAMMVIKPIELGQPECSSVIESYRAVIAALWAVDRVIFDNRAADNLSTQLPPDIYVKDDIYSIDTLPKAISARISGGKVPLIQVERPTSTTVIIQPIIDSSKK